MSARVLRKGTAAEKRAYYKTIYQKYKHLAVNWSKKNAHKIQAWGHQKTVKQKHPDRWKERDIETPELAEWLLKMRGSPCRYCGEPGFQIDHKWALSQFGPHKWNNLQITCSFCNNAKSDYLEAEFLRRIVLIAKHNNLIQQEE